MRRAQPIYGAWTTQAVPISTTILAVLGQIELHLTAQRAEPRRGRRRARRGGRAAARRSATRVYSADGRPLEAVVGDLLRERG